MARKRVWLMALLGTLGVAGLVAALTCCLSGCGTLSYYGQSVAGHLELMRRSQPVSEWLQASTTPEPLRQRLELSQRMRAFAVAELALPENASYRSYADLKRPAVVWNVVAAPELSLQLKTWCFPVMGCVGYRGYFDKAEAEALAKQLKDEGLEVSVYGVPAYSTLGWMNWAGGDPLLNTFIQWPEVDLARLIFHELAHQVVYVKDDTMFNESFAVAVERLGSERWLKNRPLVPGQQTSEQAQVGDDRRAQFREFTRRHRQALEAMYKGPGSDADKRQRKAELMQAMRADYAQLKATTWAGYAGYDAWVKDANNASMGVQAAYNDKVAAFMQLFHAQGDDFHRFYAAVRQLADLPRAERNAKLTVSTGP